MEGAPLLSLHPIIRAEIPVCQRFLPGKKRQTPDFSDYAKSPLSAKASLCVFPHGVQTHSGHRHTAAPKGIYHHRPFLMVSENRIRKEMNRVFPKVHKLRHCLQRKTLLHSRSACHSAGYVPNTYFRDQTARSSKWYSEMGHSVPRSSAISRITLLNSRFSFHCGSILS